LLILIVGNINKHWYSKVQFRSYKIYWVIIILIKLKNLPWIYDFAEPFFYLQITLQKNLIHHHGKILKNKCSEKSTVYN